MLDTLPRLLGASVLVYALAANAWALVRRGRGALPSFWRVVFPPVQALFMLGPPYAGLLSGRITPAMAGFDLPSTARLWESAALPVAALLAVSGIGLALHRTLIAPRYPPGVLPAVRMRARLSRPWGFSSVIFDALCYQAHWAFYRLAAAQYLHDAPLGAAAGSLLVLFEWALDPGWRGRLFQPGLGEEQWLLLGLLGFSALLALLVPGFWLLLAVHAVLWLLWYTLLQRWYRSAAGATLDSGRE